MDFSDIPTLNDECTRRRRGGGGLFFLAAAAAAPPSSHHRAAAAAAAAFGFTVVDLLAIYKNDNTIA